MDQLHVQLKSKPKQSVFSRKLSKGATFSVEKPPKSWNKVYYFRLGFSKCVRLISVLRIGLLFEKQYPLFFPLSEGSACELLPDLSFYSMNSVDALGMPKHLLIITFDRYFCSCCAHAAVAVTLPRIKTCSRVFIISQVPPFAALHCHEQSARFFPKHAYCVTHVLVRLELT